MLKIGKEATIIKSSRTARKNCAQWVLTTKVTTSCCSCNNITKNNTKNHNDNGITDDLIRRNLVGTHKR